jgi:hypothetical protein
MVYTRDLKSLTGNTVCRFESDPGHRKKWKRLTKVRRFHSHSWELNDVRNVADRLLVRAYKREGRGGDLFGGKLA